MMRDRSALIGRENKNMEQQFPGLHSPAAIRTRAQASSGFLLVLAAYFVLQIVVRLSLSDSLDLDEAEQAFVFQHLSFGYGTQPPLYAWLQWLMFSIFGVNLFALAALKNLLLFATYLGMFYMARPLIGVSGAMAASASLLLLPAIGWESQRDLTHSVLLTCVACATLWSYFALLRQPSVPRYALLGILLGLGLQSKYNFAVFTIGLISASLLVSEHRQTLWNRKSWIAIAAALLCLLPHGLWLLNNLDAAVGGTLQKMSQGQDAGYLLDVASGLGSMCVAALAFITPLWLIYGWICRRDLRVARVDWPNPNARFFLLLYASFFILLTLLVLSGEVRYIKSRWMLPLLFSVPLAFFVLLPTLSRTDVHRRILCVAAFFALLILLALPGRVYLGAAAGKHVRAHHPYPQLSADIAQKFPQVRTLIVDTKLVAGNLYFQRPELHTLLLNEVLQHPGSLQGELLLVVRSNAAAGWLERFRTVYPDSTVLQQGRLDLPLRYGSAETMSFEFAHVVVNNK